MGRGRRRRRKTRRRRRRRRRRKKKKNEGKKERQTDRKNERKKERKISRGKMNEEEENKEEKSPSPSHNTEAETHEPLYTLFCTDYTPELHEVTCVSSVTSDGRVQKSHVACSDPLSPLIQDRFQSCRVAKRRANLSRPWSLEHGRYAPRKPLITERHLTGEHECTGISIRVS